MIKFVVAALQFVFLTRQKAQEETGMKSLIQVDAGTQRTLILRDLTSRFPGSDRKAASATKQTHN